MKLRETKQKVVKQNDKSIKCWKKVIYVNLNWKNLFG